MEDGTLSCIIAWSTILTEMIASQNDKIFRFRIFSLSIYFGLRQRKKISRISHLFCKCGLLWWLVRAQLVQDESKLKRTSGGNDLPFYYEINSEKKIPGFP